jgi:hypothetical protein
MVNDDKPFLRITPDGVIACGSPWMGKHGLGANIQVPLKAICILERGEVNRIAPISAPQALPMLLQQSQRPANPKLLPKYLQLIDQLSSQVAFYHLDCKMDHSAAILAYETMSQDRLER